MNAIDMLKEDHDVVDALFKRIESEPPSRHAPIFKKIKNELDTHAHVEEKVFYPALSARDVKELNEITAESFEEHAQIKKFLAEIARSTSKEKREAKLKVLIEDTRHHVKEEENEMFPLVEDNFTSQELEELGDRMAAEKQKFQKAKRIPARREQPKGAVTQMLEKAKEFVASLTGDGSAEAPKKRSSSRSAAKKTSSAKKASSKSSSNSSKSSAAAGKKSANGSSASSSKRASSSKSASKTSSARGGSKTSSSKRSSASKSSSGSAKSSARRGSSRSGASK